MVVFLSGRDMREAQVTLLRLNVRSERSISSVLVSERDTMRIYRAFTQQHLSCIHAHAHECCTVHRLVRVHYPAGPFACRPSVLQ